MSIKLAISSGQLNCKVLSSYSFSSNHGAVSSYLVGDLLGTLRGDGTIETCGRESAELLLKHLEETYDIAELSLNSYVGNFTLVVVLHDKAEIFVAVSTSGVSPYIVHSDSRVLSLEFDENKLIRQHKHLMTDEVMLMLSASHQLVNRYPTSFFGFEHIWRVPSGHTAIYKPGVMKMDLRPYLHKSPVVFTSALLRNILCSILRLYNMTYGGNIGLLFSGGLDSSCIAASLQSEKIKMPFYHIDYKGPTSQRSSLAHQISKYLGYSTLHLPRHHEQITATDMYTNCITGLVTVPNTMYLGAPINQYTKPFIPKYLITGQGADSIYVIDSFAPPTETIGQQRIKQILASHEQRLALVPQNILSTLGIDPYSNISNQLLSSDQFRVLLSTQCISLSEHVNYSKLESLREDSVSSHRQKFIAEEVYRILEKSSNLLPKNNILEVYRYIKWMRSLVNVPMQYASMSLSQGVTRLTPYLEGPIVSLFFSYGLRHSDALSIKHELELLFWSYTSSSHRGLVEDFLTVAEKCSRNFGDKAAPEMAKEKYSEQSSKALKMLRSKILSSTLSRHLINNLNHFDQYLRIASLI